MTNKQVIIDGVDVNGCLFYQTNFEEDYDVKIKHYCSNWHISCESNNNSICYYKQLARAEQENKRLLEIINANPLETVDIDSSFEIEKLKEQLQAKEQECEELKHEVELMMDCASCKVDEYKKTLAEIKEICENNDELQGDFNVVDCDKYKLGKHNLANKILQKISEVENEN